MSKYDGKELLGIKPASREYDVPEMAIKLAIKYGTIKIIEVEGKSWLTRHEMEQYIKRTIKRGAGNKVLTAKPEPKPETA